MLPAICVTLENNGIAIYTTMDMSPGKVFQHHFSFLEVKSFLQVKFS